MKEITGGLWFAGLSAGALLGLTPALICIALGAAAGIYTYVHELRREKRETNWRKTYPPYGY